MKSPQFDKKLFVQSIINAKTNSVVSLEVFGPSGQKLSAMNYPGVYSLAKCEIDLKLYEKSSWPH